MEVETIHGQIIAKANHYQAVPGKFGAKRIIKDEKIRAYERSFMGQMHKVPQQAYFLTFPAVCPGVA